MTIPRRRIDASGRYRTVVFRDLPDVGRRASAGRFRRLPESPPCCQVPAVGTGSSIVDGSPATSMAPSRGAGPAGLSFSCVPT